MLDHERKRRAKLTNSRIAIPEICKGMYEAG
jgi:hypothetical protein